MDDIILIVLGLWLTSREMWNMVPMQYHAKWGHDGKPLIIDEST